MKKLLSMLLISGLSIGMFTGMSFGEEAPKIFVNGNESKLSTSSIIKNGRTWISMSSILTILGYDVSWDESTKTSTVFDKSTGIRAQFSETTKNVPYTQTGIEKVAVLNEAPFVKDGRTFLQLNVFADIFCKDISYNATTNSVFLNDAYSDDIFEISSDVSGPISIGQNFKIGVSSDGSYEWKVMPNANFAYYGLVAEGVGRYSMYFKALAYEEHSKLVLKKVSVGDEKEIGEEVFSVVVRNQGIDKDLVEPKSSSKSPATLILLENNDDTKSSSINVNDTFIVNLSQNSASTGYEWKTTVPSGLEFVSKDVQVDDVSLPGSSVTETWTFKAVTSGSYTLNFDYSRAWESNKPSKTATFSLVVK